MSESALVLLGLYNKGTAIGGVIGILKGLSDARLRRFILLAWLVDLTSSVLIGWSMWDLVADADIASWQKTVITAVFALVGLKILPTLMEISTLVLIVRVIIFKDQDALAQYKEKTEPKDGNGG